VTNQTVLMITGISARGPQSAHVPCGCVFDG